MGNLDSFRIEQMRAVANLKSFRNAWPVFEKVIRAHLGANPTSRQVLELGSILSKVFQSNAAGRSQSAVAAGGTAWECLVLWYLNLVAHGTQVVVVRPVARFLPPVISSATAMTIRGYRTNTESDLVAFSVPTSTAGKSLNLVSIHELIWSEPKKTKVTVVQCKTNWNDNAQIPMLWGLIYDSSGSMRIPGVSLGEKGVTPGSFGDFRYSFVTVPTSKGPHEANKLHVQRVGALSGGNYWGHPSSNGVAKSLEEFFTTNFHTVFSTYGTVENAISKNVLGSEGVLEKYLSLAFS